MNKIKFIATAYDVDNSVEYIELDEKLSIVNRETIEGITTLS